MCACVCVGRWVLCRGAAVDHEVLQGRSDTRLLRWTFSNNGAPRACTCVRTRVFKVETHSSSKAEATLGLHARLSRFTGRVGSYLHIWSGLYPGARFLHAGAYLRLCLYEPRSSIPIMLHLLVRTHGLSCLPVPFVQMCSKWRVVSLCSSAAQRCHLASAVTTAQMSGGGGSDPFKLTSEMTLKQLISWNPLQDNALINE